MNSVPRYPSGVRGTTRTRRLDGWSFITRTRLLYIIAPCQCAGCEGALRAGNVAIWKLPGENKAGLTGFAHPKFLFL